MLELFNFANAPEEINRLFGGKKENLVSFIEGNNLDGMELMACEPLQEDFLERRYVKGSHLIFWPTWFG
ncbi:MAG: xylose isomerase, partial [Schwartzia sp.]|nr:xylose isomerase [Schwartzia sp. (in: firmicutes)]